MRNDIIVLILTTVVSFPLGLALGQAWLLPILNALPAYIVIVHRLRKGERGGAVRTAIWWAGALAIAGTVCLALWPGETESLILNGAEYRNGMLAVDPERPGHRGEPEPLPSPAASAAGGVRRS